MTEEFQALLANNTWELVNPSHPIKFVGKKWVFKIKYNPDGSISSYKAKLVVKSFHQIEGINYTETFSPLVKSSTIKLILSMAVTHKWVLRQININSAFINGYLTEEVCMQQIKGFVDLARPTHVCKLYKALDGLKQALRTWFERFKLALTTQWGFSNSNSLKDKLTSSLFSCYMLMIS